MSKGVHVREQVIDLLLIENLPVSIHFAAAELDDLTHPLIIRGQAADLEILSLEDTLQARTLLST